MTEVTRLAEDYVLGHLDEVERRTVEARIAAPESAEDRELAAAIRAFAEPLHELDTAAPEAELPEGAWDRLEAALDREAPDTSSPKVVPLRAAADPRPRAEPRLWRMVAGAAMAACVALAAVLWSVTGGPPDPLVMAVLLNDEGESVAVIEAYGDDSLRITPLAALTPENAQVLQVWTKPDPDGPPVSLAILEAANRVRIQGPDLPLPTGDQLYEITLEPSGGSPTGLPTGPILGKGLAQPAY